MGFASSTLTRVDLQLLQSRDDLSGLESEWGALYQRCPDATPFQSPDWLLPFCSHVMEGDIFTLALRSEGRLVGLALFFIHTAESGHRHLLLLGTGTTDYLDVLFEPEFVTECTSTLFEFLQANTDAWDVLDLQQLRSASVLLTAELSAAWTSQISVQEVCPVLALPEDTQSLPETVPLRMLAKVRYYRRALERLPCSVIDAARLDNFAQFFDRFVELHQARRLARDQHGVLAMPPLQRFQREAGERMLLSGTLRLYALRAEGTIAGTLFAFSDKSRTYFYQSGFDAAFARHSPSTLLIGHAIEQAIAEGSTEFDFLRGREAYKYMWGARGRLNYRRLLRCA